jgi:hypothetical protein
VHFKRQLKTACRTTTRVSWTADLWQVSSVVM